MAGVLLHILPAEVEEEGAETEHTKPIGGEGDPGDSGDGGPQESGRPSEYGSEEGD